MTTAAIQTKNHTNVYFDSDRLKKVEALALRRDVSKSDSSKRRSPPFLLLNASIRVEVVLTRRMDRIGCQIDLLD